MNRQRFTIELEAVPGWNTPAVVRLRALLKAALRTHGLRCVTATETQQTADAPRSTLPNSKATT